MCRWFAGLVLSLLAVAAAAGGAAAQEVSKVTFASGDGTKVTGYLMRPDGAGARPAVIALHGCGGPLSSKTGGLSARHLAWGEILTKAGFVVLFPDSFGSRGHGSLCRVKPRPVKHRNRLADVDGANTWLSRQGFVEAKRISVLGWSNGGSTALRLAAAAPRGSFQHVIAFYPGCRSQLKKFNVKPAVPLKIIMGAADDWTPAEPCVALAKQWGAKIVLYEGAYHSFDAPDSKVRVRRGMAYSKNGDGTVHVGTHVEARDKAITEVMRTLR